jgi:hypothetical protein
MAMREAMVLPPDPRIWGEMTKLSLRMKTTAMVSPRARPRPEHHGADHPAPTEREDDPADHARLRGAQGQAPSFSPGGRGRRPPAMTDAMMGTIMIPTTSPAMNSEAFTLGVVTLKIGIQARWRDIHEADPDHVRL